MPDVARLRKRIERLEDRLDEEDDRTERRRIQRQIDKLEDALEDAEDAAKQTTTDEPDPDREEYEKARQAAIDKDFEDWKAAKAGPPPTDEKPGTKTGSKAGDAWFGEGKRGEK